MDKIECEYEYNPSWKLILFGAVFFGFCAFALGAQADGNNRGLSLRGLIDLEPAEATVFFWILCGLSIGFVLAFAVLAYRRLTVRQRLAFGPTTFLAPRSWWSGEEKEIAYRDIKGISRVEVMRARSLHITYEGGKFAIVDSMLPSKAAFEEVYDLLVTKVRAVKPERLG